MGTKTEILSLVGSICSVVGFFLTLWVLLKLRRIHRNFLFQARLPDLKRKIRGHSSSLSKLLNTFPDSVSEVEIEVQKCNANLQSLKPKLDRKQATSVTHLLAQTKEATRLVPPSKEQVRKIYLGLVLLEEELENLSEDIKWRSRE